MATPSRTCDLAALQRHGFEDALVAEFRFRIFLFWLRLFGFLLISRWVVFLTHETLVFSANLRALGWKLICTAVYNTAGALGYARRGNAASTC